MRHADGMTRRAFALSAAALALSGCAVRLERDAPSLPLIARQAPPPDAPAFTDLYTLLDALVHSLDSGSPIAKKLATCHRTQRDRALAVAASNGVEVRARPTTRANGIELERSGASVPTLTTWLGVSPQMRPMFSCVAATNAAGARLLAAPIDWSGDTLPEELAVAVAPATYAATYILEVVAARTPASGRTKINASLALARTIRTRVEVAAGAKAPLDSSDYVLAAKPDDDAARTTLTIDALSDLVRAVAAQALTPRSVSDMQGLTHLWSDAISALWPWQADFAAFPGLSS